MGRSTEDLQKIFEEGNKIWTNNGTYIDYNAMLSWLFEQDLEVVIYTYNVFYNIKTDASKVVCQHIEYVIVHKELISRSICAN